MLFFYSIVYNALILGIFVISNLNLLSTYYEFRLNVTLTLQEGGLNIISDFA